MQKNSYLVISIIVLLILFIPSTFFAYGVSSTPQIFSKESRPYGLPYTEWIIKWWQWHISLPKQGHPFITPNLENCPVGKFGSVAFLTHSLEGESHYTCAIPAQHAILLPISNGECNSNEAHSDSPAVLLKCATEGQKYGAFEVTVDGVALKGLEQNNAISRFFNITIPQDNVYGLNPGTFKAVVAGYYVFLKPLPVGEHNISIAARVINPIDKSFNFNYHASYLLKVQ
jgi:hypothetical protein